MTVSDPAAWPSQGPESIRRRLYRALARAVDASRTTAAVAFLSSGTMPLPWIVVRPKALIDVVRAEPALSSLPFPGDHGIPEMAPPPGSTDRFATAVPHGRRTEVSTGDRIDRPSVHPLCAPGGWLGVQTFWVGGQGRGLWAARRWRFAVPALEPADGRADAIATALAEGWGLATGVRCRPGRLGIGRRRDWRRLATATIPREAWVPLGVERADATAEPGEVGQAPSALGASGHAILLGASGAGKSWLLADRAAREIREGRAVFAIDLHGDLAPAIVSRLDRSGRDRIVCIDLSDGPVPGISAIASNASPERAAAHLVAALKRLSPDGTDLYWGFRLERIFDAFVRLAQEAGGSLRDVQELLMDADRREAARLATRSPDLARFLEELGPIVRRTPDFLWSASSRLSKVIGSSALAGLLAPDDGGIPVEELLSAGRSILVRMPFADLGPEASALAGTLILARTYLGMAARSDGAATLRSTTVVLDEVQGFSPRLVAEMLAESRKFGLRLWVATQFPERMAPELRASVEGVVGEIVVFRVPPPSLPTAGRWLGLSPPEAARWLADLPPGHALARDPERADLRPLPPAPPPPALPGPVWAEGVVATRTEFGPVRPHSPGPGPLDLLSERLLLAVLAAEEEGRPLPLSGLAAAAERLPGPPLDLALLADRSGSLQRRGYIEGAAGGVRLTPAGERYLGHGSPTGAPRESAEHRRLLLRAFRLFARRGHRLEIVRQGRFDTRLPDAVYRQIPGGVRAGPPEELAPALDRIRCGWAWQFFGGRDVHVEAEVSGALRPSRVRHGVAKARARGAFVLFLVSDARRAATVRKVLDEERLVPGQGQVWTLGPPAALVAADRAVPAAVIAGRRGTDLP